MTWDKKRIHKQVSCFSKKRYSKKTAKKITIEGFKNREHERLYSYKCKYCTKYHLTKIHPVVYKFDALKRDFSLEKVVNRLISLALIGGIVFAIVVNTNMI